MNRPWKRHFLGSWGAFILFHLVFFFIFQLEVGVTNLVGIVPLFVGIVGMTNISPHTLVVRGRQRAHKLVSQCICIVSVFVLVLRDHTG